jgi:hypothetical protein
MHALAPEIRIVEIFTHGVAEQARDVVADEDRGEIVFGLEAVDHSRRRAEQARQLYLCRGFDRSEMLTLSFFVLARCFGQDTLDDVGHFSGIGAGLEHFSKCRGSNLCVFSWGVMGDLIVEDEQTGGTPRHARIVSGSRALSMTGLGTTCAIHVKVY